MFQFYKRSLIAVAIAVSLVLAACGSTTTATKQPTQATNSKYGGTLTIEVPNDPARLDPATVLDNDAGYVMATLYDGLTAYKPGTTQVIPGLATSWHISQSGKTYTFTLRKGVRFSDGSAFNAKAVQFWLEHMINKQNPDYYAKQSGIQTFVPFTFGSVASVKVLGPYKIAVSLSKPNGEFLADLAMVWNGVTSPAALKKWGTKYYQHPAGTGPFHLVKWVKGQYVEEAANKSYWGGKPYLNKIIFKVIPDTSVQLLSFKTGSVGILTDVAPSEVSTIKAAPNLKLISKPGLTVNGVSLPTQVKPFSDPRVRQALNYAINKAAMDSGLYFNLAQAMNSPLPKACFGYDANVQGYGYNLAKAKQLLAAAGYPKGFHATLLAYTGPRSYNPIGGRTLATAIKSDLAAIGVRITINSVDSSTWLSQARSTKFKEMSLVGWSGDNGDPDDMISPLFNGNAFIIGNFAHYNNPTVNKLFAKALVTSKQSQRAAYYAQAQKTIMKDAPWIFLNSMDLLRGVNKKVHGFVPNPTFFYFNMNKVWLSK